MKSKSNYSETSDGLPKKKPVLKSKSVSKKSVKKASSVKMATTPVLMLPIPNDSLLTPTAGSHKNEKLFSKLKVNVQAAASANPEKKSVSKNLVSILNTLKDECDNINSFSKFTSPALKNIQNPVMLINNKQVGPIKKSKKPDGVVNLDLIMRKRKTKEDTKSTVSNASTDRIAMIRDRLDDIIKKHTLSLNEMGNSTKPYITMNNKGSSFMNSLYVQSLNEKHNEIFRYATSYDSPTASSRRPKSVSTPRNEPSAQVLTKPFTSTKSVPKSAPVQSKPHETPQIGLAQPTTLRDDIRMMRDKVDEAIRNRKVFTVCGNYYSIRNALVSRGWVEKLHTTYVPVNADINLVRRLQFLSIPELVVGLKDKELSNVYKQVIYSKMIGGTQVSFYWDINRETYRHNAESMKNTIVNFISKNRFNYANKQGLCESSKQAYWFNNPGVSYLRTPRSYSLINNGDPDEFIYDFKVTAAMSFLKWSINLYNSKTSKLISNCGKIPIANFHFALEECAKFAQKLRHEDIDKDIHMAVEHEWQEFLEYFYKAVHVGNHFKETNLETELSLVHKSRAMLKKLSQLWPYTEMDGYMNIWLLKPSYGSRGIGIHFCRTLQYVLKVMKDHKNSSYVIQKYIERPLLIHNTKFDIRQWFLISCTLPITIWIYKECYLRFSSQTYNLRKLHESIHLTNNSVQSKYHNGNRDPCLPLHNMWFLKDFKEHLSNMGYPKVFNDIIYPGMKECITAAILANQDQIYRTPMAFELHGADFMITEDFKPWLIEINSKPALSPSTPVTSKLCPAVLEDVIKVVVDYHRNPKSSTGNFELLYKENLWESPNSDTLNLKVHGKPVELDYFLTPEQVEDLEKDKLIKTQNSNDSINIVKTTDYIKYVGREMKATLQQLLLLIEKEKERRKKVRENRDESKTNELNSFMYCEDMERLKTNMKEIEEIFTQDVLNKVGSDESVEQKVSDNMLTINLANSADDLLHKNSTKIKEAITTLNCNEDGKNVNKVYSSIVNIIGKIKFPGNDKKK